MLNISGIQEGYVLDHIKAGMSLRIYHDLKLDKLTKGTVAIIMNAVSNKMGTKDIIKVECPVDAIDLDILGYIDKTVEKYFKAEIDGKVISLENVDIYKNIYKDSK